MAKSILGKQKHKLCEEIAGKKYTVCLTRGGWKHHVAECWISNGNADWVNYKVRHWWPKYRDNKLLSGV
jgi:hypothetical protein